MKKNSTLVIFSIISVLGIHSSKGMDPLIQEWVTELSKELPKKLKEKESKISTNFITETFGKFIESNDMAQLEKLDPNVQWLKNTPKAVQKAYARFLEINKQIDDSFASCIEEWAKKILRHHLMEVQGVTSFKTLEEITDYVADEFQTDQRIQNAYQQCNRREGEETRKQAFEDLNKVPKILTYEIEKEINDLLGFETELPEELKEFFPQEAAIQ